MQIKIGAILSSKPILGKNNLLSPTLSIIKILGRGVCGPVYLAKRMDGPIEYYAIKIIYKNQPDTIRRNNTMSNELSLHQKLHHDNIIKLKFSIELNEEQILMALEYCDGGDLYDHLTQPNYFYPKDWILFNLSIKTQFLDILKAVQYCHLNGIYHRDIKPENILLTSKNEIKLADFGLSTNFPYSQQYNCGSGYYMAPEIQQQNQIYKHYPKYNCIQADKWSLGILFLNLCCGKNPWESANYNDINFIEFVHNPNFLLHLFPLSKLGLKIALSLLKINPDSRIELDNLIQLVENTNIFVYNQEELDEDVDSLTSICSNSSLISEASYSSNVTLTTTNVNTVKSNSSLSLSSSTESLIINDTINFNLLDDTTLNNHKLKEGNDKVNKKELDNKKEAQDYNQLINDSYLYLSMFP